MGSRRQRQVAELLHEEISQLIQFNTQDPRLGFVTVTGVDVTPDLRQARVFVTTLGDEVDGRATIEGLTSAAGYFRHELGRLLSLRYVPHLTFELDTSLKHGLRIESLLNQIKEESDQVNLAGNASSNFEEND
jgi:ribosome-binding factor A